MSLGGLQDSKEPDDRVFEIVQKIKPKFEEESGLKLDSLAPLSYRHQVVAGKNYFVKAEAKVTGGEKKIVHLRIYENLKQELSLTAHQLDKTMEDTLEFFQ